MKPEDTQQFIDASLADARSALKRTLRWRRLNVSVLLVCLLFIPFAPTWWIWVINSLLWAVATYINSRTLRTIRSRIRVLEEFDEK